MHDPHATYVNPADHPSKFTGWTTCADELNNKYFFRKKKTNINNY